MKDEAAPEADDRAPDRAVDDYLVVAAQAGDRRALDALVRRWNARLLAHAWRLIGDRALAEEAAQAAWIDIARSLGSLRDERAFPAWAYRITTRRAATGIRQLVDRRREQPPRDEEEGGPDALEAASDEAALRRAVAALPAVHRAAVALHYFEGLTVAETAVALGVPAGTIKTRLMHARAKLRATLEGEDHV